MQRIEFATPTFMHAIKSPLVDPPKLALLNLNENFADPESPQVQRLSVCSRRPASRRVAALP
jgi:hypothetical protein